MSNDLTRILNEWPYDPDTVNARKIAGDDGEDKIQMRVDLGIYQMEIDGRPDGSRPRGCATLLDYYGFIRDTSKTRFKLNDDQLAELQQEAAQYYYRYLACFSLKDYDRVVRDTRHNLAILDFIEATYEGDMEWEYLQFKPGMLMMQSRALAEREASHNNYAKAIEEIERGLESLRDFWKVHGEEDLLTGSYEEEILNELLENLRKRKPSNKIAELKASLHRAINLEDYEKAADIRDQLNELEAIEAAAAGEPVRTGVASNSRG